MAAVIDVMSIVEAQASVRGHEEPWFQHSRDQLAGEFRDLLADQHGIDMRDPAQAETVLRLFDLLIDAGDALAKGDPRDLPEQRKIADAIQMLVFTVAMAAGDVVKAGAR